MKDRSGLYLTRDLSQSLHLNDVTRRPSHAYNAKQRCRTVTSRHALQIAGLVPGLPQGFVDAIQGVNPTTAPD